MIRTKKWDSFKEIFYGITTRQDYISEDEELTTKTFLKKNNCDVPIKFCYQSHSTKVIAIKNDEKDKDDHKHLGFCFQTMDDGMSLTDISESEVYEA